MKIAGGHESSLGQPLEKKKLLKKLSSKRVRQLKANGIGALLGQLLPESAAKAHKQDSACEVDTVPGTDDKNKAVNSAGDGALRKDSSTVSVDKNDVPTDNEVSELEAKVDDADSVLSASKTCRRAQQSGETAVSGSQERCRSSSPGRHASDSKATRRKRKAVMPDEIRRCSKLRKYWFQRYRLFSRYDEGVRLDREGWFSVTPEHIARHVAERCRTGGVALDAFCGVGGNAIQLATTCRQVIAVDICPERVRLARHNAAVYGVAHRIQFVVADFFQLAPRLRADVVFLAPPWGGPDYCSSPVYDMFRLDGVIDGREMMRAARRISPNVALMAPRNANQDQLAALAGPGGRVEVEKNLLNGNVKTITAYYGGLIVG